MVYTIKREGKGLAYCNHKTKEIVLGEAWMQLSDIDRDVVLNHEIWHSEDENVNYDILDEIEADIYSIKKTCVDYGIDYVYAFKRLANLLKGKGQEHRLHCVAKNLKIRYLQYGN